MKLKFAMIYNGATNVTTAMEKKSTNLCCSDQIRIGLTVHQRYSSIFTNFPSIQCPYFFPIYISFGILLIHNKYNLTAIVIWTFKQNFHFLYIERKKGNIDFDSCRIQSIS